MIDYVVTTALEIVGLVAVSNIDWGHENIGILIVIAIIINLFSFRSNCYYHLVDHNKKRYQKIIKSDESYSLPKQPDNTLTIIDKYDSIDSIFRQASFNNGEVYCNGTYGTFIIGYYQIKNNQVTVLSTNNREIGRFSVGEKYTTIYLSNLGFINYMQQNGWYSQIDSSKDTLFVAAEIFESGIIIDKESREGVATYTGDMTGAAAAFVCLEYECSDKGKYYDFFHTH